MHLPLFFWGRNLRYIANKSRRLVCSGVALRRFMILVVVLDR